MLFQKHPNKMDYKMKLQIKKQMHWITFLKTTQLTLFVQKL